MLDAADGYMSSGVTFDYLCAHRLPVWMMCGRREIAVRFPDEGATMPFRKRGSYLNGGCDTLRQHSGELR